MEALLLGLVIVSYWINWDLLRDINKLRESLNKLKREMETLKLGNKGANVEQLQKALNLTVDGIFGKNTEKAVKEFQKKNNLTVDGVVGDKTWNLLGFSKSIDPSVVYKPLSKHITNAPGRAIKYLAIHFTAGSSSKAGRALNGVYETFMSRSASADFAVDDQYMVQFNPNLANYYCWAIGDKKNPYSSGGQLNGKATNKNTISIEICSTCNPATSANISVANNSAWSFTDASLNNAVKLAKIIMNKYNIPLDRVVRHYDITGKLCPGIIGWNNEAIYVDGKATKDKSDSTAWEAFKNKLK